MKFNTWAWTYCISIVRLRFVSLHNTSDLLSEQPLPSTRSLDNHRFSTAHWVTWNTALHYNWVRKQTNLFIWPAGLFFPWRQMFAWEIDSFASSSCIWDMHEEKLVLVLKMKWIWFTTIRQNLLTVREQLHTQAQLKQIHVKCLMNATFIYAHRNCSQWKGMFQKTEPDPDLPTALHTHAHRHTLACFEDEYNCCKIKTLVSVRTSKKCSVKQTVR